MSHIFVSYAREDAPMFRRISEYLRKDGLPIWTDESLGFGTQSWSDAVEIALENSDCLIVLMSPNSKTSKWVKKEINYAADILHIPVFCVLIDGEERNSIPFVLTHTQYADVRQNFESLAKLSKELHQIVNRDKEGASTEQQEVDTNTFSAERSFDVFNSAYETSARNDWELVSLGSLASIRVPKRRAKSDVFGDYPQYGANGIVKFIDHYQFDGEFVLLTVSGSTLLTGESPIGRYVHGQFTVNSQLSVLECSSEINARFLAYFLSAIDMRKSLAGSVTGYSMPRLNIRAVQELPIALPPLAQQIAIADALDLHLQEVSKARAAIQDQLEAFDELRTIVLKRSLLGEGKQWH